MRTPAYSGRATIDPSAPDALGICQRCGNLWNLRDLQYQFQWQGPQLQNTYLRVCPDCMDVPSEFLRTIILPPDPEPVLNALPIDFVLAELTAYIITTEGDVDLITEDDEEITTELQSFDS